MDNDGEPIMEPLLGIWVVGQCAGLAYVIDDSQLRDRLRWWLLAVWGVGAIAGLAYLL